MPFGLTNAPGVFQRLMQCVLMGLNPEEGPDFVAIYIDDIIIFSRTLEDHIDHLRLVFERLVETGLKLKPTKCQFVRKEVEYLGHVITPQGFKTNPRLVAEVQEFPVPQSLQEVHRFLGLSSYYWRFIPRFAKIAQPLHQLTLKQKLTSAPDWPIRHLTSHSPWKQTQASRALVRYSLRNRKMGSSIQLHMQAVRCHLQNATIASPSWRHLP